MQLPPAARPALRRKKAGQKPAFPDLLRSIRQVAAPYKT